VPPKVRNFVWKLIKNGLPTNGNRCFKHITVDASCEMCFERKEDCYHAVMGCPHAVDLRGAMRELWCMPLEDTFRDTGPEWFLAVLDSASTEEVADLAMVLWRTWEVRNKITQAGAPLSIDDSVLYLSNLGKSLNELKGVAVATASVYEGQDAGEVRCPGRSGV
jgi:hypothetical protein